VADLHQVVDLGARLDPRFTDRRAIDGLVNFLGWVPLAAGAMMRSLQNGLVQFYALVMVLGLVVLLVGLVLL